MESIVFALVLIGIVAFLAWAEWDIWRCFRTCDEFNRKAKAEGSLTYCECR